MMNKEEHIKYWLDSSEEDWISANEICQKNERKHFALFIAHLSLEKFLKALYIKKLGDVPPYKHDLYLLASKSGMKLTDENIEELKLVNEYNLQARYPEYKDNFYKKCTFDFVSTELNRINKLRQWTLDTINNTQ
ncbi:MAG: HEPN domain-containing protein [Bacteroidetes bacterium]|nr:HEPN domain-containing protein [Bacteroidota bacterium]MBU2586333.1 HEPN domain-containing protein [Bacteroidota bacterium]